MVKDVDISQNFLEVLSNFSNKKDERKENRIVMMNVYDKDGNLISFKEYTVEKENKSDDYKENGNEIMKFSYKDSDGKIYNIIIETEIDKSVNKQISKKIKKIYIENKDLEDNKYFTNVMKEIDVSYILKNIGFKNKEDANKIKALGLDNCDSIIEKLLSGQSSKSFDEVLKYLQEQDSDIYTKTLFYDNNGILRISFNGAGNKIKNLGDGNIIFPKGFLFEVYDEKGVKLEGEYMKSVLSYLIGGKINIKFGYNEEGTLVFIGGKISIDEIQKWFYGAMGIVFGLILIYSIIKALVNKKNKNKETKDTNNDDNKRKKPEDFLENKKDLENKKNLEIEKKIIIDDSNEDNINTKEKIKIISLKDKKNLMTKVQKKIKIKIK